ncbi:MAG TPA: hypothetical protein VKA21_11220 [Candidatus Binatia bacterium]|nr:hypothetical protein [Candidatus Binatia bacterium]
MWRVNVPNPLKVDLTRLPRADALALFAAMREMAVGPFSGTVYALGNDAYYRVVEGYNIFFDLIPDQHVVNVTAVSGSVH